MSQQNYKTGFAKHHFWRLRSACTCRLLGVHCYNTRYSSLLYITSSLVAMSIRCKGKTLICAKIIDLLLRFLLSHIPIKICKSTTMQRRDTDDIDRLIKTMLLYERNMYEDIIIRWYGLYRRKQRATLPMLFLPGRQTFPSLGQCDSSRGP